jgi:hypothetical protein
LFRPLFAALVLNPLLSLAQTPSPPARAAVQPAYFALAVQTTPLSSLGFQAEYHPATWYAFQAGGVHYNEFQGVFPSHVNYPREHYDVTSVEAGATAKEGAFELGAFTGLGYAQGVVRGKHLSHDDASCYSFCFGAQSSDDYEKVDLADPVVPFSFYVGGGWKYFGLRFHPHVYAARGHIFVNAPFVLQLRVP